MAQDLPTQDGYIIIAASRPMWWKFCVALDAPALLERLEYATAVSRVTHREALNAEIERVTQTQTSAAWIERTKKHPLLDILVIALCTLLTVGKDSKMRNAAHFFDAFDDTTVARCAEGCGLSQTR